MATPNHKNLRTSWGILFSLIAVGLFCLGFSVFAQEFSAPYEGEFVSVSIMTDEQADYSTEPKRPRPPVSLDIVADVLRDLLPPGTDITARLTAFFNQLQMPVPSVASLVEALVDESAASSGSGESAGTEETEGVTDQDEVSEEETEQSEETQADQDTPSTASESTVPLPQAQPTEPDEDEDEDERNGEGDGGSSPPPSADLSVTKDDGVAQYTPGNTVTYTIVVSNNGPDDVSGAQVSDNKPAQVLSWTWTCVHAGGASGCDGVAGSTGNFSDMVDLPNGGSITYTVTANTSSDASGNLNNTVSITPPAGTSDPSSGNDSATDTDTANPQADLAVTKDDGVTEYTPGGTVTYTIVVSNNGPSDVAGAEISDNKPAQVSSWTWTCVHAGGGCDGVAGSTGNFSDTVDLPNGGSITYTVTANTSSDASGNLDNTVSIAPPAGTSDPTSGNDSKTDTDTANPQADLAVTKNDGVTEYTPGGTVTYTIVVSNNGPSDANGAQVSDNKPAQVSSWTWTCNHSGGASGCDGVSGSTANFSDTVDLPNGGSITYTVTADISAGASGNLANTVSVAPPTGTTDPTPGNDSATDTDTQATSCSAPGANGFVSSITPADGSTGVAVTVNPVIQFNQAMDASTLIYGNKDNIALCSNNGCGQIVSASVTISTTTYTNDTVTIAPDVNLNTGTDYWVNAGGSVENSCDTPQGVTVQAKFTTQ